MTKKRKTRRSRVSGTKADVKTYAQQRESFPESLVKAFVAVSNSGWEDDKLYEKYVRERNKYLKTPEDPIEESRLVVNLARATMDIREGQLNRAAKTENVKTKKKTRKKRAKKKS